MSILGRFLEHERVLVFGPPGEEEFFLSSADWMPRNLHRRVEIMFPVEAPALREQIRAQPIESRALVAELAGKKRCCWQSRAPKSWSMT